jgi:hypothetical protein
MQLVKWPSKVKFSRGPKEAVQYSSGGADGEEVEVPQIDESLSLTDFSQALVNLVGNEDETKKIINKNVLALPAIREGQTKFKQTFKKTGTVDIVEATKAAILAVRDFIPYLAKERGAVVTEAFAKASQMDVLKAARQKVADGSLSPEEFQNMLEAAFAD